MPADARLTVDLDALADNYACLRGLAGGAETAAVVKADGYGLGAAAVARRLQSEGVRTFFVARVGEGEALRRALGAAPAILVLDGCPPGAAGRLASAGLTPVLNSVEQIADWRAGGVAKTPVALHIDTGMSRLGLRPEAVDAMLAPGGGLTDLPVELVISHLSCASSPDHPMNAAQRDAFSELRALFPDARASLANSAGLCLGEAYHFDMVRPGVALYGGGPFGAADRRLAAVATLEAPILQVREIRAGESVGYGAAFTASHTMRIAVVAAGYADGVLRAQSSTGYGWLAGHARPLLGRVSMDLIAIDLSEGDGRRARPGDMVELLGPHVALDEVAAWGGTISYEVLTRLSTRAERLYRGRP
jgi:alanine racemase